MTRGEGDSKEEWYSIYSRHREHNEGCRLCQTGRWINCLEAEASRELFKRDPEAWREKANRYHDSGRRFLESVFPGLR